MKLIRKKRKPCAGAVYQGSDIWLVPDDCAGVGLAAANVARRYDVRPGHPLYGKRALRSVPAGYPDIVMSESGELEVVEKVAPEPEPEPEPRVVEGVPDFWWR